MPQSGRKEGAKGVRTASPERFSICKTRPLQGGKISGLPHPQWSPNSAYDIKFKRSPADDIGSGFGYPPRRSRAAEGRRYARCGAPTQEYFAPSLRQPEGRFVAENNMKANRSECWFEKLNFGPLLGDESRDILAPTSTNIQQIHTCLKN